MDLHPDFVDLLAVLEAHRVEYLVVGGYAVGFHSRPRYTKDIDLWIRATPANRERLAQALDQFGAAAVVTEAIRDATPSEVVWMGVEPVRADFLQTISGVDFDECFPRRVEVSWAGIAVSIIGRADLIANKRASGRPQDLLDADELARAATRP